MLPSIVGSLPSPPRRPQRSPPREPGRRCSRARTARIATPMPRGYTSRGAWSRGREWRGAGSRLYPAFAEDRFSRELFLHALSNKLVNALFLFGSEPSEPSEPRIRILLYARGLLR